MYYSIPHTKEKKEITEYILPDESLYFKYPFKYDAILIDEYQDYDDLWISNIQKIVKPKNEGGELVFFCDEKQSLYERESSDGNEKFSSKNSNWEIMPPRDFRGNIHTAYLANAFQNEYLKSKYEYAPVKTSNRASMEKLASISYLYCSDIFERDQSSQEICNFLQVTLGINIQDVCFIAKEGEQLRSLNDFLNIGNTVYNKTNTMIETTEEYNNLAKTRSGKSLSNAVQALRKPLKEKFFGLIPEKVTLSTVASFKGWEADIICLLISRKDVDRQKNETIYTGLTRARKHLIIINDDKIYDDFFRTHIDDANIYDIPSITQEEEMPF